MHWSQLEQLEHNTIVVQEFKLGLDAQSVVRGWARNAQWNVAFGAPCPPQAWTAQAPPTQSSHPSRPPPAAQRCLTWNAVPGGVMTLALTPIRTLSIDDLHTWLDLHQTNRWLHTAHPIADGRTCLHVSNLYGNSGASSNPIKHTNNECLLKRAVDFATFRGRVLVLLCLDANVSPEQSQTIRDMTASERWIDVGKAHADTHGPRPTYAPQGCTPESTTADPGCTRIDLILANRIASQAINSFRHRYDIAVPKHTPLEIRLVLQRFFAYARVPVIPRPFRVAQAPDWDPEQ